jgi:hypothetical protein
MNGFFTHPPAPALFQPEADEAEEGSGGSGQGKLCARGHWRPAEDARLKDLVAQYGPQNWNLIAEKLDGRSGKERRTRYSSIRCNAGKSFCVSWGCIEWANEDWN